MITFGQLVAWDQAPQKAKKTKKKNQMASRNLEKSNGGGAWRHAFDGPQIHPPAINLTLKRQHIKFSSQMFLNFYCCEMQHECICHFCKNIF